MKFIQIVFILLLEHHVQSSCRGPHHPRGEPIVKRHVHYKPSKDTQEKLTQDVELLHDEEHIKEHLEHVIETPDFSKLTPEEIEFYFFQFHDSDKNSKLDGLELLNAIIHVQDDDHHSHNSENNTSIQDSKFEESDFDFIVEEIDRVLLEDDLDDDGFLTYAEYAASRKNAKAAVSNNI